MAKMLYSVAILVMICGAFSMRSRANHDLDSSESESAASQSAPFAKNDDFVCTEKWDKHRQKFTNQYCLIQVPKLVEAGNKIELANKDHGHNTPQPHVANDLSLCESKGWPYRMKVCPVKGKEDIRISYSERVQLPKACFYGVRIEKNGRSTSGPLSVPVLVAALSADDCMAAMHLSKAEQGTLKLPPPLLDELSSSDKSDVEEDSYSDTSGVSSEGHEDFQVEAKGADAENEQLSEEDDVGELEEEHVTAASDPEANEETRALDEEGEDEAWDVIDEPESPELPPGSNGWGIPPESAEKELEEDVVNDPELPPGSNGWGIPPEPERQEEELNEDAVNDPELDYPEVPPAREEEDQPLKAEEEDVTANMSGWELLRWWQEQEALQLEAKHKKIRIKPLRAS